MKKQLIKIIAAISVGIAGIPLHAAGFGGKHRVSSKVHHVKSIRRAKRGKSYRNNSFYRRSHKSYRGHGGRRHLQRRNSHKKINRKRYTKRHTRRNIRRGSRRH